MKKLKEIKIKEFDRTILSVDIILYLFISFLGLLLLKMSIYEDVDNYICAECLLMIIGFVSMIAYAVNRRKNNYEFLLFSCINILCGLVLLVNESNSDKSIIIGNIFLIYFILYIINKFYNSYRLYKSKDVNFIIKLSFGLVLGTCGIFISYYLLESYKNCNYLLGNYFILFGLVSIIEPLCEFLLRNPKIDSKVRKILKYENKTKKAEKKTIRVREVPRKKIKKINK